MNQYNLWGRGVHASYSSTSISGKPLFHYGAYGVEMNFSGDDIRVSDTPLGQMVTVTIKNVPDLRTDTFTIVIPPINGKDDEQVRFRAVGIYAVHHTSIGGPDLVRGPLISYDSEDMVGIARTVIS
jgi:hypothetical protein